MPSMLRFWLKFWSIGAVILGLNLLSPFSWGRLLGCLLLIAVGIGFWQFSKFLPRV